MEPKKEVDWKEEDFYFGLGVHEIYRTSGDRIQYRVEKAFPLKKDDASLHYLAKTTDLAEFLAKYEDCAFVVSDGYIATNDGGSYVPPNLWVIGWLELVTEEHRQGYWKDKKNCWQ